MEVIADSIRFNFDTQKAIIWQLSETDASSRFGTIGEAMQ